MASNKKELEKLERIILKKAIEIEGRNDDYKTKLLRSQYPTMNKRLCPWKEIRMEKRVNTKARYVSHKKLKNKVKKNSEPYFKNMAIAQEYNIYPVQKPIFPTPLQFIFIGEEEYENLQNDIFRDDANYLFPKSFKNYSLSKYFYKWKNKTTFTKKKISQKKKKTVKKKANNKDNTNLENFEIVYKKKKWLNDDYEESPISLEYYSQKRLKPTKASERLFQSSLTQVKFGD